MVPTVGQTWRSHATGSLWRIASIDLSMPGDCVELRLVEPSKALVSEWEAIADQNLNMPQLTSPDPRLDVALATTLEGVRQHVMARPMFVEIAWFGRAGTFVSETSAA